MAHLDLAVTPHDEPDEQTGTHGLSYLDLALPEGGAMDDDMPEWLGDMYFSDPLGSLSQQLQELSALVGGDADAPQFLQEMLMLQMQAEGWRVQWSVAMQENEELRARLYDTRNSLELAGGSEHSEEHWRELCISIAKSAEDEKAQILQQLANLRQELERTAAQVAQLAADKERFTAQAAEHKQRADEWSAKTNEVIKARNEANAKLFHADTAAAETEESIEHEAMSMHDLKRKAEEAERETDEIVEQLRGERLSYEARLSDLDNSHREQVEALAVEISHNEEELQQGREEMQKWRTQWEEELEEKNSIDAELLTLRSEFEKSSATYDREIAGLKDMLEKERASKESMKASLDKEGAELLSSQERLAKAKAMLHDLENISMLKAQETSRGKSSANELRRSMEQSKHAWEASVKRLKAAEVDIAAIEAAMSGATADSEAGIAALREELAALQRDAAAFSGVRGRVQQAEARKAALDAEIEAMRAAEAERQRRAVSEQAELQDALSEARSAAAKWEQQLAMQGSAKAALLEEVNSLKAEAKEITDAHTREVERLQERLRSLEATHDSLEVSLAAEEAQFTGALRARREAFDGKVAQQEAAVGELMQQHEDVRSQLAEVRTLLSQEQRERTAAAEAMRDAQEAAAAKVADVEEREAHLAARLAEIQSERARIEKEAADEKARFESLLQTMQAEQAEVTRKRKEAHERAVEFERQWVAESTLRKNLHNQLQELVGNLRVFCRIRPLKSDELTLQQCVTVKGSDTVVVTDLESERKEEKKFTFTQVYGQNSTQEDVFRDTEALMTSVLDGYNVCIFAYGQSGTGKTFTMEGTDEMPGLVPRAMSKIFEVVGERQQNFSHECFLSMIEIYNETIKDLLADPKADNSKKKYDIMRDSLVGMYVKDLTSEPVHTTSHCKSLVKQGNKNRATGATNLNEQSSRSHMLVTLTVRTRNLHSDDHYVGKLSLCDLAGSERLSKSLTSGAALKETQMINKSLSALGTVIAALATNEKHVPFRDSKLTYLLQDSLGGNSKTLMFVNAGPAITNYAETVNSLNFASRAKNVSLGKATKNREAEGKDEKKASATMAAVSKLGSTDINDQQLTARSRAVAAPTGEPPQPAKPSGGKEKKQIGPKKK